MTFLIRAKGRVWDLKSGVSCSYSSIPAPMKAEHVNVEIEQRRLPDAGGGKDEREVQKSPRN